MYPAGQHPMYPYTEEEKLVVLENVGIKEAQLKNDAEALINWVLKQPHLAEAGMDSHAAELYIIMSKDSVQRAKQRIDFYYRERAQSTQEIQDRLLKELDKPLWQTHVTAPAPRLFKGSRVTFMKIFDWESLTIEDVVMNMIMLADIRFSNDFSSGETWIIDIENASLGQIIRLNFTALNKAFWLMRDGLGLRIVAIHVINCGMSNTIQAILNICKQFLSQKLLKRLKFHETPEALHEILPREYLLEDYGGTLPSFKIYKDEMEKMMTNEKTKGFLINACKRVSDESKRPKTGYSEDLQGNFKKLVID